MYNSPDLKKIRQLHSDIESQEKYLYILELHWITIHINAYLLTQITSFSRIFGIFQRPLQRASFHQCMPLPSLCLKGLSWRITYMWKCATKRSHWSYDDCNSRHRESRVQIETNGGSADRSYNRKWPKVPTWGWGVMLQGLCIIQQSPLTFPV